MTLTTAEIDAIRVAYKAGKITAEGAAFAWGGLGPKGDRG